MTTWWVRQVLSWGRRAMPALDLAPGPFPHAQVLACQGVCNPRVTSGEACCEGNKSPSFLLAIASSAIALLYPRHSHTTARVLEAGLN